MDSLFHRYRNITVLLVVIFAQLALLAWQVRSDNDVPIVRTWAVTAVTPVASLIENVRSATEGFFNNYIYLRRTRDQTRELQADLNRLKLENQLLKNELANAQRAEALAGFQSQTPSKMIGARVIGATPGVGSKSLLVDRGTSSGVHKGMAVVTPEGIVGRVVEVFPFASQVLSVTDPGFAAGVESQKNHVHGVLKGTGNGTARVDYVGHSEKVERGELFYTSGEDRIFPRGLPAGKVTDVTDSATFKEIIVDPPGAESTPEEVLIILDPVHGVIPEASAESDAPVFLGPDVKTDESQPASPASGTQADKLLDQYRKIGEAQKHVFGDASPVPNFNLKVPGVNAPAAPVTGSTGQTGATAVPVKPAAPAPQAAPKPPAPAAATPSPPAPQTPRASPPAAQTPAQTAPPTTTGPQ